MRARRDGGVRGRSAFVDRALRLPAAAERGRASPRSSPPSASRFLLEFGFQLNPILRSPVEFPPGPSPRFFRASWSSASRFELLGATDPAHRRRRAHGRGPAHARAAVDRLPDPLRASRCARSRSTRRSRASWASRSTGSSPVTFVLGCALAAAAGIIYALARPRIEPLLGLMSGLKAFVAAVLGGIGSVPGRDGRAGSCSGSSRSSSPATPRRPYRDAIAFTRPHPDPAVPAERAVRQGAWKRYSRGALRAPPSRSRRCRSLVGDRRILVVVQALSPASRDVLADPARDRRERRPRGLAQRRERLHRPVLARPRRLHGGGGYTAACSSLDGSHWCVIGARRRRSGRPARLRGRARLPGWRSPRSPGSSSGMPSLRLRGDYLAIVTLGFGEIMRVLAIIERQPRLPRRSATRASQRLPQRTNVVWLSASPRSPPSSMASRGSPYSTQGPRAASRSARTRSRPRRWASTPPATRSCAFVDLGRLRRRRRGARRPRDPDALTPRCSASSARSRSW